MKALYFPGHCELDIRDIPVPEPGPGETLVRVMYSGVCQTDVRSYVGVGNPNVMGHEFIGEVVAINGESTRYAPGDWVTCYPFIYCGECPTCRAGLHQVCPNKPQFNVMPQGGYAECICLPERAFMPFPKDMDPRLGVLVLDVFGMMHHALKMSRATAGTRIGIVGAQPYGLGAICLCSMLGAETTVFDSSPYRLALAKRLGSDVVITAQNAFDAEHEFDIVVECDEPAIPIHKMVKWIRPGGVLCVEGHTGEHLDIPAVQLTTREISIVGTPLYALDELDEIHALIRRSTTDMRKMGTVPSVATEGSGYGTVPTFRASTSEAPVHGSPSKKCHHPIITHMPTPENAKEALDAYVRGEAGKIAIDFTQDIVIGDAV